MHIFPPASISSIGVFGVARCNVNSHQIVSYLYTIYPKNTGHWGKHFPGASLEVAYLTPGPRIRLVGAFPDNCQPLHLLRPWMKVQGRVRNNYGVRLEVSAGSPCAKQCVHTRVNTVSSVQCRRRDLNLQYTSSDREDGLKNSAGGNHHAPPVTTRWIRSE